jgi:hypothetical protein
MVLSPLACVVVPSFDVLGEEGCNGLKLLMRELPKLLIEATVMPTEVCNECFTVKRLFVHGSL